VKSKSGTQETLEVIEQLEEEQIDLNVVRWFASEDRSSRVDGQQLERLRYERGDRFYSDLMFALAGQRFPQQEARQKWEAIVAHRDDLTQLLRRNPGIVVAALDWITNLQDDTSDELSLIDSGKLENMLERAVVDGLTGLYDHDTLITLLGKEIERARRHDESIAVLMLDLDDFKRINDEHGHQKGDEVLTRMATIMRETLRTMDIPGRYGGEEFMVILPETEIGASIQSAERLREAVEVGFEQGIGLTVSVGSACFPGHAGTVEALIAKADEALYRAKKDGKNCVVAAKN
jgi:diguanylate cyclase (GGDEF)-like protein